MNKAAHIQGVADALIAHAEKCGVVLTIDAVPQLPLAMGNVKMVAHARPARTQPPQPAFDLDKACDDAMTRIRRHVSMLYWNERYEIKFGFDKAREELDDRMKPLILSAKCRGWLYRLGWVGVKV